MSQRLVIPLLVALAFIAGYGARVWTERGHALPPPPADLVSAPASTPAAPPTAAASAERRAKLIAEIEKIRPQIETYRRCSAEIDAEFDRAFVAILTPEQKEHHVARQKRDAENLAKRQAKEAAETGPLSDERITNLQQNPVWSAIYKVAPSWRLERDAKEYKLDERQQAQLKALLVKRREKFIDLLDSSTPPSIRLSHLALQVQRLGDEPAK